MYKHKYIVSGGTFDHFHSGHVAFLHAQLALSEKVLLGVTSDTYIQQYKEEGIEPYKTRVNALEQFFLSEGVLERVEIQKIDDYDVPQAWERYPIEAIVVTEDTKNGAERVNAHRKEKGDRLLTIYTIEYVAAKDGNPITSSRIRRGEIDREGIPYREQNWLTETLLLPSELRQEIAKPFSKVFKNLDTFLLTNKIYPDELISVGDVITKNLEEKHIEPKVRIVDLFVQRKRQYNSLKEHTMFGNETIKEIKNPAGRITPALWKEVQESIFGKGKYVLFIEGEEDLAVLPCVLTSPLGFHVLYGQPERGIVAVYVTEKIKKEARDVVGKFTVLASNG